MSITSALQNATSGLSAASRRADVVSNNIANALTPGFARKEIQISANVVGGQGSGVKIDGVTRAADQALTTDRRLAESTQGRDVVIATANGNLNNLIGEPGDPNGLFGQLQQFESSLRSLSQSPESQPLQTQTLQAAHSLVGKFQTLTTQTQTIRFNADQQIAAEVKNINATLKEIERLNTSISIASAGGRDATAMEDQRKALIDEISQSIPIREVQRDRGKVDLITNEGVFLIAGKAREIEFTPANTIGADQTVDNGGLSGMTVGGASITPGDDTPFALRQGTLAGLFAVRDDIATDFQKNIDGLARDVIERFQDIDPTLAAGEPGLFTDAGAVLDPDNETGLAGRIAVNAAVDPAQGGELWRLRDGLGATAPGATGNAAIINTFLDALTTLKAPPASTGQNGSLSLANLAANITSTVGQNRIISERSLGASTARTQSLIEAEQATTAVDSDLELQKLLLIEQAFSANARVIQTADEMLSRLLEI